MTNLFGPVARIILRYVAGTLTGAGVALWAVDILQSSDAELIMTIVLSTGITALVEYAYSLAKKHGGKT